MFALGGSDIIPKEVELIGAIRITPRFLHR